MFTEAQVKAAKATRNKIIRESIRELKAIYMAGEIVMWDELRSRGLLKEPKEEVNPHACFGNQIPHRMDFDSEIEFRERLNAYNAWEKLNNKKS